jgi:hypothetical protein
MTGQTKPILVKASKIKPILFFAFFTFSLFLMFLGIMPLSERATPLGFGIDAPMTHYLFEQDNLSVSYPKSWNLHLTPSGNHGDKDVMALITVPWHPLPEIIVFRKLFKSNDLSDVVKWRVTQLKNTDCYKLFSSSTSSFGNITGATEEYKCNSLSLIASDSVIHCKDFHILQNSIGYVFSFCSYAKDWEKLSGTFNKIIESVRILE